MNYQYIFYNVAIYLLHIQVKKSILQRDPESKAMLELMGRTQVSEGFKEVDEDEDQSEEMKRKMNTIPKLL